MYVPSQQIDAVRWRPRRPHLRDGDELATAPGTSLSARHIVGALCLHMAVFSVMTVAASLFRPSTTNCTDL